MIPWKQCGNPAHTHDSGEEAIRCMLASGRWWTIIESDRMEKGADVYVSHPRIEVPIHLEPGELQCITNFRLAVIRDDGSKITVAMKAMRAGEGSPIAAAATRN